MKIWIVWAHWVGKTTIINELSWNEAFRNIDIEIIPEIARSILKEMDEQWHAVDVMNFNRDQIFQLNKSLIFRQMQAEDWLNNFISDRTILDVLAYSMYLLWENSKEYEFLFWVVKEYMKDVKYDVVFYIPIEFKNTEEDKLRSKDEEYRKIIDDNIIKILRKFKIDYKSITWTVQERVFKIIDEITPELYKEILK